MEISPRDVRLALDPHSEDRTSYAGLRADALLRPEFARRRGHSKHPSSARLTRCCTRSCQSPADPAPTVAVGRKTDGNGWACLPFRQAIALKVPVYLPYIMS